MVCYFIEEFKKVGVLYFVVFYEVDVQFVYLECEGVISGIVFEDLDMLVFGVQCLLIKMDQYGQCVEIWRKDFCLVCEIFLIGWMDVEFWYMVIFSGCDYLGVVNNIGLKIVY